jgi:hypothetical protein
MAGKGTFIEIVQNDFVKIAAGMHDKAGQVVRETVLFIEGQSKSDVPIGPTGALAGGIQSEIEETGDGWKGAVFDPVEYASYVNYGTGSRGQSSSVPDRAPEITYTGSWLGMPARPFMSQAAADGRPRFEAGMKKIVG